MLTPENTHRTLHVFNPSHDEALAAGTPYYYPSVIARKLASAWALLPALWANNGDVVWVPDDVSTSSIPDWAQHVMLVHQSDLKKAFWETVHEIAPWGWDALVRQQLNKAGAPQTLLPNDEALANVRQLSSRNTTALVLPKLRQMLHEQGIDTVGTSHIATSLTDVEAFIHAHGEAMAKALWSCSGRGVFRITPPLSESCIGRIKRLLREQGALELEPIYNSVMDFALEFEALADGNIHYTGVSLFHTTPNGGYSGNIIAPQTALQQLLPFSEATHQALIKACCSALAQVVDSKYVGCLGIDMMWTTDAKHANPCLHPCIEVNVRRTMGQVAIDVEKHCDGNIPACFSQLFHVQKTLHNK